MINNLTPIDMKHFKFLFALVIAWMAGITDISAAVDDTFTVANSDGVNITYKVLTEEGTTGTVQVGIGD